MIRIAHERAKTIHSILDETCPRLQGAYECQAFGIPHTVTVDGAVTWVMKTFDVTPTLLITAIITEKGIIKIPFSETLANVSGY